MQTPPLTNTPPPTMNPPPLSRLPPPSLRNDPPDLRTGRDYAVGFFNLPGTTFITPKVGLYTGGSGNRAGGGGLGEGVTRGAQGSVGGWVTRR